MHQASGRRNLPNQHPSRGMSCAGQHSKQAITAVARSQPFALRAPVLQRQYRKIEETISCSYLGTAFLSGSSCFLRPSRRFPISSLHLVCWPLLTRLLLLLLLLLHGLLSLLLHAHGLLSNCRSPIAILLRHGWSSRGSASGGPCRR